MPGRTALGLDTGWLQSGAEDGKPARGRAMEASALLQLQASLASVQV